VTPPDPRRRSTPGWGDVEAFLGEVGLALEPYLRRAVDRVPDVSSLRDGVSAQVAGGGKRIRAGLCVTACEIFCGSYRPALGFAAAVEHLQNFTLIHDDIADGDAERRGVESAWKRFGLGHGITIGDAFVPLACLAILDGGGPPAVQTRLLRVVSEFGLQVAAGQTLDLDLRRDDAPTVDAYVDCTRRKTGAFFAMAAVGGALLGGAPEGGLRALTDFASDAGVAFQIKDDVIDAVGGKGRQVGSDVAEGKRTLVVAYALERSGVDDGARLLRILNAPRERTSRADVDWALDLYWRTRALDRAERTAETLVDQAVSGLLALPEVPAKYRFLRLGKYLTQRIG
jgi:geranylgeranyl diphosphate synthase type I